MTFRLFPHFVMILTLSTALPSLVFAAAPDTAQKEAVAAVSDATDDDAQQDTGIKADKDEDDAMPVAEEKKTDASASPEKPAVIGDACNEKLANDTLYDEKKKDSYRKIVVGDDGWLFRTSTDLIQEPGIAEKGAVGLKRLTETLEQKGVTLIVAYPPTRGIVAGEHLPKTLPDELTFDVAKATETYRGLMEKMKAEGIHLVTVNDFAKDNGFFRKTDHHWNTEGARQMAKAVADYTKTLKVYKDLKKTEFESAPSEVYTFQGSFGDVVHDFCDQTAADETDQGFATSVKASGDDLASALMGDASDPEVILVGTSNSKAERFSANFDGALKEYLSADVYNAAFPGAGIDEPLFAYLSSESFRVHPPKIIIWEIPGYYSLSSEREMFRQAIATVYGDCEKNTVLALPKLKIKGDGEGQGWVKDLESKKISPRLHYVALKFNQPVKNDFTFLTDFESSKTDKMKFHRSKRYPHDGVYFATLRDKDRPFVSSFSIKAPDDLKDFEVEGRVCAFSGKGVIAEAKKKFSLFDFFKKDKGEKKDKKSKKKDKDGDE